MQKELKLLLDDFLLWENISPILVSLDDAWRAIAYLNKIDYNIDWSEIISNLTIFETDESSFKIENTRAIIEKASIKPGSDFSIFLIKEIDKFTEQASNSLLKIFEDVPDRTIFILTTNAKENILETIRSRIMIFSTNWIDFELWDELKSKIDSFFRWDKKDFIKTLHSDKLTRHESVSILSYIAKRYWTIVWAICMAKIEKWIERIYSSNANQKWITDDVLFCLKEV